MSGLRNTLEHVKDIIKTVPNVQDVFIGDIYDNLNANQSVCYPAGVISKGDMRMDFQNKRIYTTLNIFLCDRETDDKSNKLQVQSWAVDALYHIAKKLHQNKYCIPQETIQVKTFEERFGAVAAGAFLTCEVFTPMSECESLYTVDAKHRGGYNNILKVADYLYETWYEKPITENEAEEWMKKFKGNSPVGACSIMQIKNYIGRNLDWYYTDLAEFIIHTPAKSGKHEVFGMAGNIAGLNDAFVDSGQWDDRYKYLPYMIVDGMNDTGLFCGVAVTPNDSPFGRTTGTNPDKPDMNGLRIVKYILDHHSDAREAAEDIRDNWNVYMPQNGGLDEEFHYLIVDPKPAGDDWKERNAYLLEFINNQAVVTDIHYTPMITNFHLQDTVVDHIIGIHEETVEDYGQGLERYIIMLLGYINFFEDRLNMQSLGEWMSLCRFTNAYTQPSEQYPDLYFKTEFTGINGLKVTDDLSLFLPIIQRAKELYQERDRKTPQTWQTCHTIIYDMDTGSIKMAVQENYNNIIEREITIKRPNLLKAKLAKESWNFTMPEDITKKIVKQ